MAVERRRLLRVLVGAAALVLVAGLVVGVLGWFWLERETRGVPCRVTAAGAEYRRTNGVGEADQLPNGEAGDEYHSNSGCLPEDDRLVNCRVTETGVEERRTNGVVERDQQPKGKVGKTYRSYAGCVPGDEFVGFVGPGEDHWFQWF